MPKETLRAKALKTLQKLVRLKAANDKGVATCVTCGIKKPWNKGIQGGHWIPKGNSSYWALEEENIHPQCSSCNQFGMKNGSAGHTYTLYMIDMYGRDVVDDMLARKSDPIKIGVKQYRDMIEGWEIEIDKQLERIV